MNPNVQDGRCRRTSIIRHGDRIDFIMPSTTITLRISGGIRKERIRKQPLEHWTVTRMKMEMEMDMNMKMRRKVGEETVGLIPVNRRSKKRKVRMMLDM